MQTPAARFVRRLPAEAGFWACVHDAGAARVLAAATDGRIYSFEDRLETPQPRVAFEGAHRGYVTTLALAGPRLVSGGYDRRLAGWRLEGGGPAWVETTGSPVKRLAASPDGMLFVAAHDDLSIGLREVATGRLVRSLEKGHAPRTILTRSNTLYSAAYSPDGKLVATGDRVGEVCLWDPATGSVARKLQARSLYSQGLIDNPLGKGMSSEYDWGGVRSLAFSPDGRRLYAAGMGPADQNSAGIDGLMKVEAFDTDTGKSVHAFLLEKRKGVMTTLVVTPDQRLVGAGGGGGAGDGGVGTLLVWQADRQGADGKPVPPATFESPVVLRDVAIDAAGRRAWTVGLEKSVTAGRIELWSLDA